MIVMAIFSFSCLFFVCLFFVLFFCFGNTYQWLFKDIIFNWYFLLIPREKAMAPHSSTVAQKIPWMEEPGRLQSMGSLTVRQD